MTKTSLTALPLLVAVTLTACQAPEPSIGDMRARLLERSAQGPLTQSSRRLTAPAVYTTDGDMSARTSPATNTGARRATARTGAAARTDDAIHSALNRTVPALHLDSVERLRDAGTALSRMSGVDIMVDSAAERAFADSGNELTVHFENPVRLRSALNLITDTAGDDVAWTVRYGAVLITSKSLARGAPKTSMIDVSELLWAPPHFAAPKMDLLGSDQEHEYPEPPERTPFIDEDVLLDAIMATVRPGTWDEEGNSLRIVNGKLIVTHD